MAENIIVGSTEDLTKDKNPFVTDAGEYHAYFTNLGMILCVEVKEDKDGEYWDIPLILETVSQRNPNTGEVVRSQGFRPLVPLTKDTKFRPLATNSMFAMEIFDEKLKAAYQGTVRDIKAQMAGIITPPTVGSNSGIIVGS